jgi:hypothetical protein
MLSGPGDFFFSFLIDFVISGIAMSLMLEGSYYDANITERKYKVKCLEFLSNKPD